MSQKKVVFYFIRHGETMLNIHNRMQGWSDAPLTPKGEEGILSLAKGIKESQLPFLACYSSDSGRAQQTSRIILENIGQSNLFIKTDSRLREYSFGNLEAELGSFVLKRVEENLGCPSTFLKKKVAKGEEGFIEKVVNEIIKIDEEHSEAKRGTWPAESFREVTNRMKNALDDIKEESINQGGGNILIVSHGLSIMSLVQYLDPLKEIPLDIKNGSFTRITYYEDHYRVNEFGSLLFKKKN